MSHDVERAPGRTTRVRDDVRETDRVVGRTSLAAKDMQAMPAMDELPPIAGTAVPPGTALYLRELISQRIDWFVALREQVARVGASGGPGAVALRDELALHVVAFSAFLDEIAPEIRRIDHPMVTAIAIEAVREIERAPIARSPHDLVIAQNLSRAGGLLAASTSAAGWTFGQDVSSLAGLIDILGSVAGMYAAFANGTSGRGNVGDVVAGTGALLGLIAAARGATWLGVAAMIIETFGAGVGDYLRTQADRDAVEAALVRASVPPHVAHAIANVKPEAMRLLADHLSPQRIVELAKLAPNLLTNPDPNFLREVVTWRDAPLTGWRLQALQNWNAFLR